MFQFVQHGVLLQVPDLISMKGIEVVMSSIALIWKERHPAAEYLQVNQEKLNALIDN